MPAAASSPEFGLRSFSGISPLCSSSLRVYSDLCSEYFLCTFRALYPFVFSFVISVHLNFYFGHRVLLYFALFRCSQSKCQYVYVASALSRHASRTQDYGMALRCLIAFFIVLHCGVLSLCRSLWPQRALL